MALAVGTRLDTYDVLAPLGSGGMGEVYRARDTRLGRDVAIKGLPPLFARDPERLARLEREAQALASLKHPNIAVIHELKEFGDSKYLILELVEGETLADLIARGPVPLDDALAIARQIAEALEAAHEKGIVHRDLKPANVKITPDGRVKVLDFGLAKINESSGVSQALSHSPTLSVSGAGVILGTAAYMSPEQARGKPVDRRADIWAFGCVLYELLTGKKAFAHGDTVSDTVASILAREPDWQALPNTVPPRIRSLIERCLRKDASRRIQDIGTARLDLDEPRDASDTATVPVSAGRQVSRWRVRALAVAAAVLTVLAGVGTLWLLLVSKPEAPMLRLQTTIPAGRPGGSVVPLSPDGRKLAFVTNQPAQIWVRAIDAANAEPIPSTQGVTPWSLFWSPDSTRLGFVADGQLKTVEATGGPTVSLAKLPPGENYSGSWSSSGTILLAANGPSGVGAGPILRVSATGGGTPEPATELDQSRKETSHRFPHVLPDGRHFLFLATGETSSVFVGDLESRERHPLPGIAAETQFAQGPAGPHLVFIRDGALMAQPFNVDRLKLSGTAFTVLDRVVPAPDDVRWAISTSLSGTLAFITVLDFASIPGNNSVPSTFLVWYDSEGTPDSGTAAEGVFIGPELSHDGKSVAFSRGVPGDIWVRDMQTPQSARESRITIHEGDDANPRWSRDDRTIAFNSTRESAPGLYTRTVGVVGDDQLLWKADSPMTLSDWSPDGKYLVYTQDNDIWAYPIVEAMTDASKRADIKPIQITKTPFVEMTPRVSPDGHWVAYATNEPGEIRVYVQSFPRPGPKQPVSPGGGMEPHWSPNARGLELFYYTGGGTYPWNGTGANIRSVAIYVSGSSPAIDPPKPRVRRGVTGRGSYSLSGGRYLLQVNELPQSAGAGRGRGQNVPVGSPGNDHMTILLNWPPKQAAKD